MNLTCVQLKESVVTSAPISVTWGAIRQFADLATIINLAAGYERVSSFLLPGSNEGQLGALRAVVFGEHRLIEQLTAFDDSEHHVAWRVVNHPDNSNPFPGSFVNYQASWTLHRVTLGERTLVEYEASFDTEREYMAEMQTHMLELLQNWLLGFQMLGAVSRAPPTRMVGAQSRRLSTTGAPLPSMGNLSLTSARSQPFSDDSQGAHEPPRGQYNDMHCSGSSVEERAWRDAHRQHPGMMQDQHGLMGHPQMPRIPSPPYLHQYPPTSHMPPAPSHHYPPTSHMAPLSPHRYPQKGQAFPQQMAAVPQQFAPLNANPPSFPQAFPQQSFPQAFPQQSFPQGPQQSYPPTSHMPPTNMQQFSAFHQVQQPQQPLPPQLPPQQLQQLRPQARPEVEQDQLAALPRKPASPQEPSTVPVSSPFADVQPVIPPAGAHPAAQQAGEPGLDSTPQQSLQPGQAQLLPDGSCLSPGAMRAQNQEPSRQSLEAERAMDTYLAAGTDSADSLGLSITQGPISMESLTSSRWASLLPSPPPVGGGARYASPPHTLPPPGLPSKRLPKSDQSPLNPTPPADRQGSGPIGMARTSSV